jgi:nucleoside-diphosphate-sugar epimerase
MRVFVTGATGHLGSAVVPELLQAGHEVVGLARSEASAAALTAVGAAVHRGDLDDLDGLREAASAADGVIHLAFKHDAMRAGDHAGAVAAGPRVDAENTIIGLADRGVRSSVVRLPPVVHSTLDKHGFIPTLIASARAAGRSGYLGDGADRWPAGHTLDAGRLYRLALEKAPEGSRLHAVGDEGIPVRQIAQTIGRHLGVPTALIADLDQGHYFTTA